MDSLGARLGEPHAGRQGLRMQPFFPGCPMSSWQQPLRCTSHITAGRALVVAHATVGLVTWLAQDECLLAVREMRDGQPWGDAGGAQCREAGAACDCMGLDAASLDSPVYFSPSLE